MKKLYTAICLLIPFVYSSAQTLAFHEDFEIADSVVSSGSPAWNPDLTLQVSGVASTRNTLGNSATAYLTTNAFSTVGNSFVLLDFDHICKLEFNDIGAIEVSDDNGNTWTQLTTAEYQGTAPFAAMGNKFASNAYIDWFPSNNSAVPLNTWWKHETFDVSALLGNAPQCMVRFRIQDANSNGNLGTYGWVIDDVEVIAAPSELNPPVITYLPPIYQNTIFNIGPFNITADITDASGIDTANVHYTINGGPVQVVGMNNTIGNTFVGVIPAVNDSDTICYYVQAIDASTASNTALNPTSGCTQFIAFAGITFPFVDDFDGSTLFQTFDNNQGSAWQLGTPNFGATNSAHSAPNAFDINLTTAYNNNAICNLVSPVFDFSTVQNAKLSFWHNFNSENSWDGLSVMYTTDGNTWNVLGTVNDPLGTNWYNTANVISSNRPGWTGNSGGWMKSEYKLTVLDNIVGPVQFRCVFTSDGSVIGDGYSIDDFQIRSPSPQDAAVNAIIAPDVSSCLPQGSIPLTVELLNDGAQAINGNLSVTYVLDNNPPVTEIFSDTILPFQTDTYTFNTLLNNTPGTHTLVAYTTLLNDGWNFNDTITITYTTNPGVNVPYVNDLNLPANANDFCLSNSAYGVVQYTAALGNGGTGGLMFDATNSSGWTFGTDTIASSQFYIWNPLNCADQQSNARLVVNTTGYNNLVLEFDYSLLYAFDNEYTNMRVKVNGQMITPHYRPNNANVPYTTGRFMLSQFLPAPYLMIDFESKVTYNQAINGTAALLDNVLIYEPDTLDAGSTLILQPSAFTVANGTASVATRIFNYGLDTLTSIPVAYAINAGTPVVETWTGTLFPNTSTTYTFTTTYTSPASQYDLCTWTQLSGDNNTFNDTTCNSFTGLQIMPVPFVDDFEGPMNFAAVTTYPTSWELGTPVAPIITGAFSGNNAWEINLNGPYQANSNEMLYSPFFDFSNASSVQLKFRQWYNCDNFDDGGRVEYTLDGGNTWVVLGVQFDPNATSWYNQANLFSSQKPGWSGNGGGYFQSVYNLPALFNNYPTPVQFRFVFTSDNSSFQAVDGWAIDNFELFMPIDAATNTIAFGGSSPLPLPGNNVVEVNVRNNGTVPLTALDVSLIVDNNTIVTDTRNFSPAIAPGASVVHVFSVPWTGAAPGPHTIKCYTDAPNGLNDVNNANDTTTWRLSVLDTFAVYPYCNDMEVSNGQTELFTANAIRMVNSRNSFEWGTPAGNFINTTHGGARAWVTDLNGNYLSNDSSGVFLPVFTVDTIHCYRLEFWTYFITQAQRDGGVIEYSYDLGQTWIRQGIIGDPNWYTQGTAPGLGAGYQPNFGGNSPGWVLKSHDVKFTQAGPLVVRFRFGADGSTQSEGWAIDDVCFRELPPCVLSSADPMVVTDLSAYPNPANDEINIQLDTPESSEVVVTAYTITGAVVAQQEPIVTTAGSNRITLNTFTWSEGTYLVEVAVNGMKSVIRVIIAR